MNAQAQTSQDHGTGAVARRAGIVVGGTLASRLLGAVRDAVIAAYFAVGLTDTFFVAWTIPNTLRGLLAEGAVSAAFIPVFSDLHEHRGREEARRYLSRFTGSMLVLLTAVACLGMLTAPYWASLYGAGYRRDPERFALLVSLTRILFPYIVFAGLAAIGMGALNALGRFAVPAFAPALLNLSLIAVPIALLPLAHALGLSDMVALAIGALLGGVLQVAAQRPALARLDMTPWPRPAFKDAAVRRSLALMLPLVLGSGIHQVDILLSRLLASFLPTGSQSFLYYGQRVVEIPQGMFAVAIASAALPSLSVLHQQGKEDEALSTLRFSMRLSLFVSVPAAVAIGALAEPIVTVIFGRGAFGAHQVEQTARSLSVMAAAVSGVATVHPVVRMFHAYGDTRSPVLCSALNLVTFVSVSLLTMKQLDHVAIALGSAVATFVQLAALLWLLRRRLRKSLGMGEVWNCALKSALSGALMGITVFDLARLGDWQAGGNDPVNLAVISACAIVGIVVYAAAAYLFRSQEFAELTASLRRRAKR